MKTEVLSNVALGALDSVRRSLCRHPGALAAFALAAGLSAAQSNAWAGGYESLGRSIGYELGRAAGPSPQGRIATLVLQTAGGAIAAPLDAPAAEQKRAAEAQRQAQDQARRDQRRTAQIEQEAREQASRDAAYVAERKRLDPNFVEPANRGAVSGARAPALNSDQRRAAQIETETREKALRDSVYAAERGRLDPTYAAMAQRSSAANAQSVAAQDINRAQAGAQVARRQEVEAP